MKDLVKVVVVETVLEDQGRAEEQGGAAVGEPGGGGDGEGGRERQPSVSPYQPLHRVHAGVASCIAAVVS